MHNLRRLGFSFGGMLEILNAGVVVVTVTVLALVEVAAGAQRIHCDVVVKLRLCAHAAGAGAAQK